MTTMLGKRCPQGPGGRDCTCCGQPPGKTRTLARREAKRKERHAWKREAGREHVYGLIEN